MEAPVSTSLALSSHEVCCDGTDDGPFGKQSTNHLDADPYSNPGPYGWHVRVRIRYARRPPQREMGGGMGLLLGVTGQGTRRNERAGSAQLSSHAQTREFESALSTSWCRNVACSHLPAAASAFVASTNNVSLPRPWSRRLLDRRTASEPCTLYHRQFGSGRTQEESGRQQSRMRISRSNKFDHTCRAWSCPIDLESDATQRGFISTAAGRPCRCLRWDPLDAR